LILKAERTISIGGASDELGAEPAEQARKQLATVLRIVLENSYEPSNVVIQAAAARSLADLAPDNPMATELSSIREQLSEIKAAVHPRFRVPPNMRSQIVEANAAVESAKNLVERLVEEDRLHDYEVGSLITSETSEVFDLWVHRMMDRVKEVEELKAELQRYEDDDRQDPDMEDDPF
jgi:hypothetical protein